MIEDKECMSNYSLIAIIMILKAYPLVFNDIILITINFVVAILKFHKVCYSKISDL